MLEGGKKKEKELKDTFTITQILLLPKCTLMCINCDTKINLTMHFAEVRR